MLFFADDVHTSKLDGGGGGCGGCGGVVVVGVCVDGAARGRFVHGDDDGMVRARRCWRGGGEGQGESNGEVQAANHG